ncbi:meiotically up-regulated 65 protein [Ophiocordyceps camponoti-floridani]|uniref:Meiotically up-regulated 65 protein n=1 Tax=Ophiocordyceps camponoti-floridani TaxID=2030778 RepID=A0A8H4Q9Z3_9HYPO|nr:meiotically up-regulated 65 protein [Ophiocordyceps camponoti-floridani]
MLKVRSSRRAAGLKPSDYDHEIDLENHDESRPQSSVPTTHRPSTTSPLIPTDAARQQPDALPEEGEAVAGGEALRPSIEVQAATPQLQDVPSGVTPTWRCQSRESAIDILYENERGGLICGSAFFSSKALGCLDPPAWTNAYHKASPTSIHTAQVPDPSWEWTWPEWRINHQDGVDEGGWEYSFAFSSKFSWHAAKWWNSFVRRRAWTRKRAQRRQDGDASGPNMLNTNYFTVRPASHTRRLSCGSIGGAGGVPSRSSMSQLSAAASEVDGDEEPAERRPDIEDMDTLLTTLRLARIDREKGEAVDNYIEHAGDLEALQGEMHEIMSLFVFQASRRQLLGRLMRRHDDATAELEGRSSDKALRERKLALDAAVYHASEEVRRLAFWSDVRQMARDGESRLSIELGEKGGKVEDIKLKVEKGEQDFLERKREMDEEKKREGAGDEQVGRSSVGC